MITHKKITADNYFLIYCWSCAVILFFVVATLLGFLLFKSFPAFSQNFIFGDAIWYKAVLGQQRVFNGIWPAIVGTIYLILLSVSIAIPIGISAGIYISDYCPKKWAHIFSFCINLLAGIPSIIMGLFGFSLVLFVHKHVSLKANTCLFVSAFSLAFLVLPYLIKTTQNALALIDEETRNIGPSLGLSPIQNLIHIRLPICAKNIFSGILLSIARCAEDTAVIMLTGVVASGGIPPTLFSKYEALPFYIFYIAAEHTSSKELALGYGASVVLLAITGGLFLLSMIIQKRWSFDDSRI